MGATLRGLPRMGELQEITLNQAANSAVKLSSFVFGKIAPFRG